MPSTVEHFGVAAELVDLVSGPAEVVGRALSVVREQLAGLTRMRDPLDRVANGAGALATEAARAARSVDRLAAAGSAATSGLGQLSQRMGGVSSSAGGAATAVASFGQGLGSFAQIAVSAAKAALSELASAFVNVVKVGAKFDQQIVFAGTTMNATAKDLALIRAEAQRLGASTAFSAEEAAKGFVGLGQAGFDAAQSIKLMEPILNLAGGQMISVDKATGLVSQGLKTFGLGASEATRVTDVFTRAANASYQTAQDLGVALKYVGPVGAALGKNIEEVAGALSVSADAALRGSMGGTGLRRILTTIITPSKKLDEALKSMGLTMKDIDPRTQSFADVFEKLAPLANRTGAAMKLFGDRGGPAFLALSRAQGEINGEFLKGADYMRAMTKQMYSGNSAADIYRTMMDTVAGKMKLFGSAVEATKIAVFELFQGPLKKVIGTAGEWIGAIAKHIQTLKPMLDPMFNTWADKAITFSKTFIDELVKGFEKGREAFAPLEAIFEGITSVFRRSGDDSASWGERLGQTAGVATAALATLASMGVTYAKTLIDAYRTVGDTMAAAWDFAKEHALMMGLVFAPAGPIMVAGVTAALLIAKHWDDVRLTFWETAGFIREKWEETGDWITRELGAVKQKWYEFKQDLVEVWGYATQDIREAWTGVTTWLTERWQAFAGIFPNLAKSIEEVWDQTIGRIIARMDQLSRKTTDLLSKLPVIGKRFGGDQGLGIGQSGTGERSFNSAADKGFAAHQAEARARGVASLDREDWDAQQKEKGKGFLTRLLEAGKPSQEDLVAKKKLTDIDRLIYDWEGIPPGDTDARNSVRDKINDIMLSGGSQIATAAATSDTVRAQKLAQILAGNPLEVADPEEGQTKKAKKGRKGRGLRNGARGAGLGTLGGRGGARDFTSEIRQLMGQAETAKAWGEDPTAIHQKIQQLQVDRQLAEAKIRANPWGAPSRIGTAIGGGAVAGAPTTSLEAIGAGRTLAAGDRALAGAGAGSSQNYNFSTQISITPQEKFDEEVFARRVTPVFERLLRERVARQGAG